MANLMIDPTYQTRIHLINLIKIVGLFSAVQCSIYNQEKVTLVPILTVLAIGPHCHIKILHLCRLVIRKLGSNGLIIFAYAPRATLSPETIRGYSY